MTPSHQFPLGVTMRLDRRQELLEWANRHGAWIIEDDYNSEFRHRDSMTASLKSLDRTGRVIYLGTFSKVMLPSTRIGYLVASRRLIEAFGQGRARIDVHTAGTAQPALAARTSDVAVSQASRATGNFVQPLSQCYLGKPERQGLLIGYGRLKVEEAHEKLASIARTLDR